MFFLDWCTALFRKSSSPRRDRRHGKSRRLSTRLSLEALEDRLAPALLTVTSLDDPGQSTPGTLRYEIGQANADAAQGQADTIQFAQGLGTGSVLLTQGLLELSGGPALITLDGGGRITVDGQKQSTVFQVDRGVQATLTGLTLANGFNQGNAAGIFNSGMLTVTGSTIRNNTTLYGSGAIFNNGTLTINASTISGNAASTATGYGFGGGIDNAGTLTVTDSTISGNSAGSGGGINNGGTATLIQSIIQGNSATGNPFGDAGGGIYNGGGALTVTNSTITGNSAMTGGGLANQVGSVTVTDSTITGNSAGNGGGISNTGTATLNRSLIQGNTATGNPSGDAGGGIYNQGTLTATNSTISGNAASTGGGLANLSGSVTVNSGTITGNSADIGGGIQNQDTLVLHNSIVANNLGVFSPDILGPVAAGSSFNLIGVGDGTGLTSQNGNRLGTAANPLDPLLAPLDYYGGPTRTFALLVGSPALAHGGGTGLPSTDQRGQPRPGGTVDIGAYQSQGSSPLVTALSDPAAPSGEMSLREAIHVANLDAGSGKSNTIRFAASPGQGTIFLTQGPLELSGHRGTASITIDGAGLITVDGQNQGGDFQVDSGVQAHLVGLTIRHGNRLFGGGILNGGTLTLSACTIDGNSSTMNGGAIDNGGTLTVSACTFSNDVAIQTGGAIYNGGTATLTSSNFLSNSTGGLGAGGGAIENVGTLTVTDCTFAQNQTTSSGGAIGNTGALTVNLSTFSGNSAPSGVGGGIYDHGTLTLTNSLLANNVASSPQFGPDIFGTVTRGSFNLIGIGDGANLVNRQNGNLVGSSATPLNPQLASLGYYGGPTQTFALLPISPARGSGNSAGLAGTTDQRGQPRLSNGKVDIGAYQSQGSSLLVTTAGDPGRQPGLLSLREALQVANVDAHVDAGAGQADTIIFAANLGHATITLTQGVLDLWGSGAAIVIDGKGIITVDGQGQSGVFQVEKDVLADLNGLTIRNGGAAAGGGIDNLGTLTVSNCSLVFNQAIITINGGPGGGIFNQDTLTVTNCTLSGNSALVGGGIANDGTLTVSSSTISNNAAIDNGDGDNRGGGISNEGTATLASTIVGLNSGPYANISGTVDDIGSNQVGGAVLLAPLDFYGGAAPSQALLPGSDAIGRGTPITSLTQPANRGDKVLHVADAAVVASTPGHYTIRIDGEQLVVVNVNLTNNTLTLQNPVAGVHQLNAGVYLAADERGVPRPAGAVDIGAYQTRVTVVPASLSGFSYNVASKTSTLTLSLANTGSGVFLGVFEILLHNLSSRATLTGAVFSLGNGATSLFTQTTPAGPVIVVPALVAMAVKPGQWLRLSLQFSNPTGLPISFSTQILD